MTRTGRRGGAAVLLTLVAAVGGARGLAADGDDERPTKKVLIVGIDGLRPDALVAARTPTFDALIADGAISLDAWAGDRTVSGPGWSSLLTGVWRDKHGVSDNDFGGRRYDRYPCFFERVKEARPDAVTASFVSWLPIDELIVESSGADIRFAHHYGDDGDARCVERAEKALRESDPDVVFVYFGDVDVAGHDHGFHPTVPPYVAQIEEVDGQVARLLAAIRARKSYAEEDWLILASTDHGGVLDGGHGGGELPKRRIFYLASGAAAARGVLGGTVNQVDVPVTAMTHLGIAIDPAWGLDGRVSGLASRTAFGENLIYNGDAERSTPTRDLGVNRGVAGWRDLGSVTVIDYGADQFPGPRSPGPRKRGRCFFSGGGRADAEMSQRIDVADVASVIDEGGARWELAGWLGGYEKQRDQASVEARFLDARGGTLAAATIGPVTLEDRKGVTGLWRRRAEGAVPAGTRRIVITLRAEVGGGQNDGYADDLSLVLRAAKGRRE